MATGALSYTDYPSLCPSGLGLYPNEGYGEVGTLRCHAVEAGAASLLSSDVTSTASTISVDDASRFPAAPFTVQVEEELMRVTSKSGSEFSVTRGYGGTGARAHTRGRTAFEARTRYVYLASAHPVRAIDAVYIDGERQLSGFSAYTGQPGSELAGYEGRAVIAFEASAIASRQFNLPLEEALWRATGIEKAALAVAWSSRAVADGMESTYQRVGGKNGTPTAWAQFGALSGTVLSQTYTAEVKNPGTKDLLVMLSVVRAGLLRAQRRYLVKAGATETLSMQSTLTETDDLLKVTPLGSEVYVYSITKTVLLDSTLSDTLSAEYEPAVRVEMVGQAPVLSVRGRHLGRRVYAEGPAGSIIEQAHWLEVTETTGTAEARVRLAAGAGLGYKEALIKAGATETVRLEHAGGSWATESVAVVLSGSVRVLGLGKRVRYVTEEMASSASALAESTARVVVGDSVTADVRMALDATGQYGGAGTLIERPDHVIRHFLVEHMGIDPNEIDAASFSAAGTSYAGAITGGYRFAFLIDHSSAPSGMVRELARQCRSVLVERAGKWVLLYLPESAPSGIRTIATSELAGEGAMFSFARRGVVEITNRIEALYRADYSEGEAPSTWLSSASFSEPGSLALYGECPATERLWAIREAPMAESVSAHMLRERAYSLMSVEFPVFYEHLDLRPGDTVELDNPGMASGSGLYFIEEVRRIDKYRAVVRGVQWWG